jgi:hypothetical protein
LLLKGQGVVVTHPDRIPGIVVGAGAAALALVLAVALLVTAIGWPVSFPAFLAYFGAGVLFVVALAFAFWAYCCYTLRYLLDRSGLTIVWGPIKHFVSIDNIEKLTPGRGENRVSVRGLGWWGYHVGRGSVEPVGDVLFFSTHRSAEDLVFIHTPAVVYAISPQDPVRFISDAQKLKTSPKPTKKSGVERDILAGHPIWADRVAQALAATAVVLNILLWGFMFAVYPELDSQITIEFPPVGDITTLQSREEILKIPATATAILAINLLAGLAFEYRERAATYLLLSGAVFFQLIFWFAAGVAIVNA